jgi:hypothetical protein
LADLRRRRDVIARQGTQVAFVHMGTEDQARPFFTRYGFLDLPRFSDPGCGLYRAFGLERGTPAQLFGPTVVLRGVQALFGGHGLGLPVGDPFQMPGVFLLHQGRILQGYRHETVGDVPDYEALAVCPIGADV